MVLRILKREAQRLKFIYSDNKILNIDFSEVHKGYIKFNNTKKRLSIGIGLEKLYKEEIRPAILKEEENGFQGWATMFLFPFATLTSCSPEQIDSTLNAGTAAYSLSTMCFNPTVHLAVRTSIAACKGICEGCRKNSFEEGMKTFCRELPIVKDFDVLKKAFDTTSGGDHKL